MSIMKKKKTIPSKSSKRQWDNGDFLRNRKLDFDSKTDLFDILSEESQGHLIKRSYFKEYHNLTPAGDQCHFTIPYSNDVGTDLGNCFIEVDLAVTKENGENLTKDDNEKIQPANDFFNSLFSKVEVLINGVNVGDIGLFHPQTALLHNLLDYDDTFQSSVFEKSNIWIKDYKYPASNPVIRHRFIEGSKRVKLFGRLNHNLFTTKRLLLPNMSVQIKVRRNSSAYSLIRSEGVTDTYKIVIHSCILNARRVLYYDTALNLLGKYLETHVARFPYTKTNTSIFQIPKGSMGWRSPGCGWGPLPKRAYFAIIEPESFQGNSWENNPMIFPASHYEVNFVEFYSEHGDPIMTKPYKPDFENGYANKAYAAFVQTATDAFRSGRAPGLTCEDFIGQYGLFAIDNMPDCGDMTVRVGFKKETPRELYGLIIIQNDAKFSFNSSSGVENA